MKKKIIAILSLFLLTSCNYNQIVDVFGNKIFHNKNDVYEFYKKIRTPLPFLDPNMERKEVDGLKYIVYNRGYKSNNLLIYIHGGAFERKYLENKQLYAIKDVMKDTKNDFEIMFLDYKGDNDTIQKEEVDKILDFAFTNHKNIIIMGDSSGGNLILATILKRRDENKKLPKGIVLLSPLTDLTNTVKSRFKNFKKDVLMGVTTYQTSLLENKFVSKDTKHPYVSPIYASYENFPKTLIQYGSLELLADDSIVVCDKINKKDGYCKLEEYDNMLHVFQFFNTEKRTEALKNVAVFIDQVLGK